MVHFFSNCVSNGYDETFSEVNKPDTLLKEKRLIEALKVGFYTSNVLVSFINTSDLFICPQ